MYGAGGMEMAAYTSKLIPGFQSSSIWLLGTFVVPTFFFSAFSSFFLWLCVLTYPFNNRNQFLFRPAYFEHLITQGDCAITVSHLLPLRYHVWEDQLNARKTLPSLLVPPPTV